MSEIKIPLSKRKLIFAFIGSAIFVLLGIQFILKPEKYISSIMRSAEFVAMTGYASVIFFGLCLIYIFYKAFDKKPGLIINGNGITDNSNFTSVGLIEWSEIIGIEINKLCQLGFS